MLQKDEVYVIKFMENGIVTFAIRDRFHLYDSTSPKEWLVTIDFMSPESDMKKFLFAARCLATICKPRLAKETLADMISAELPNMGYPED